MSDIGINFRGHAFSGFAEPLQLWFDLLHAQVQTLDSPPDWLTEVAAKWVELNEFPVYGCKGPYLDDFLIDDERIALFLKLSDRALVQLEPFVQQGKRYVSRPELGITWNPSYWQYLNAPPPYLTSVGRAFQDLLAGRISETVDNPRPLDSTPYELAKVPPQPQTLLEHITLRLDPPLIATAFIAGAGLILFWTYDDLKAWFNNTPLRTNLRVSARFVVSLLVWLFSFLLAASDSKIRKDIKPAFSLQLFLYLLTNGIVSTFIVLTSTLATLILPSILSRF